MASRALASEGGAPAQLGAIMRRTPHLIRALEAARDLNPPEWLISAGAIRDAVWDALHGVPAAIPRDIDLGFFDPDDLTQAREQEIEAELYSRVPQLPWQAKNQAAVHLWYSRRFGTEAPPFRSCVEAVATFPETAACVGVRLLPDDDLLIVAPCGLGDLLGCVCRHNAARVPASFYQRRVAEKRWRERWPRMRYLPADRLEFGRARA